MRKDFKGSIDHREGEDFYTVCGGDYWDWPWWRRILSTIFYIPWGWYRMEKGRFWWHKYVPLDSETRRMGIHFYLETIKSMAHSDVRPIWFELKQPQP